MPAALAVLVASPVAALWSTTAPGVPLLALPVAVKAGLPHVMAVINLATVAALLVAYDHAHNGRHSAHRATMLIAAMLGAAFLVLYLTYHFGAGLAKFGGTGFIRPVYFSILVVHIVTAAAAALVVPYAYMLAWRGSFARHRATVRYAWPLWMFVAVSGLVVYAMTIHLYPYTGAP